MHTNTSLHKGAHWQKRESEKYISFFSSWMAVAKDDCMTLFSSWWIDDVVCLLSDILFFFFTWHLKRALVSSCFRDAHSKCLYVATLGAYLLSTAHNSLNTQDRGMAQKRKSRSHCMVALSDFSLVVQEYLWWCWNLDLDFLRHTAAFQSQGYSSFFLMVCQSKV